MEELSKTRRRKEKLSKPLLPEDIPRRAEEVNLDVHERDVEEFRNILDIQPKSGVFFYIRIPGLICVGVLAGYLIGKFNFSVVNLFFVGYAIFFVYGRKIERFTRSLKSLVYHNARKEKARNNGETVEWLNYIARKIWEVAEPVVSAQVYQNVNNELLKVTPPFLNGLRLTEFTLGSRSPIVEGVSYINMDGHALAVEMDVAFIPLETSKDVVRYLEGGQKNWNSKIQLSARVGTKNGIGINLPILVKELFFKGKIRIAANLFSKNVFVKDVEVCLMDMPEIDFTLVPLKTVDVMDVPGLSRWIRSIIGSALSSTIVNPNSIVVDVDKISKDKGKIIGVVCLQILDVENDGDERLQAEIDVDGRVGYQTRYVGGRGIVYNEHFYIPIENVDSKIGISLRSESKNTRRRSGSIFLKNLPLGKIEEFSRNGMYDPRRTFFSKARLIRDEQTYSFANTNMQFYPLQEKRSNSGIVKMTLVGIEDLQGNKMPKTSMYSTFCTVIVSPINREESSIPIRFIENTVNVGALMMSGIIDTSGGMISGILPGLETTSTRLLPSSKSTFYVFESKRIFATNSPLYNESFMFFCRDIQVDVVSVCVLNDKTNEVIGRVSIPVKDIHFNKKEKYKLNDAQSGRMELEFSIDYVDMVDKAARFIEYERVMKVSVDSMSEKGVYYAIVETNTDCFRMETFTSVLPVKRAVHVPVQKHDSMKFRLYKETINGDVFIGEDIISCSDESRVEALLFDDHISLTLRIESEELKNYTGAPEDKEGVKVMQARFGKFHGANNQEMFVEFRNKYGVIKASGFTRSGELNDVFTFVSGAEEIYAIVKSGNQSSNKIVGKCMIPKRMLNEKVVLNESGLSVDMEVQIQGCSYKPESMLKKGYLEVYIKSGKYIRPAVQGSSVDTYCKILINEAKVYSTKPVRRSTNPVFNESFIMEIDKTKDVLGIQICDYNVSERNSLLCYTEFSLHNLVEGFSEMELEIFDAKTFRSIDSNVSIGFNFCTDHKSLSIKKRSVFGDLFGF